jgi:tRNA A37 methylthiotransferase MiaB
MKIGFLSLGCPKNLVDGEVMLGIARDAGHELTADATAADVIVVNTCAFIESARQESIDAILEMAQQKRDGQCARLVVTGCLAERYREELRTEIPEIDALLGTGEVEGILDAIRAPGSGIRNPAQGADNVPQPLRLFRAADMHEVKLRAEPELLRDWDGSRIPDPGSHPLTPTRLAPAA